MDPFFQCFYKTFKGGFGVETSSKMDAICGQVPENEFSTFSKTM